MRDIRPPANVEQDWGLDTEVGGGTTDEGVMGITADEGWLD